MLRKIAWACVIAAIASPALAQTTSATTGAINGTVIDNTKGVLPGVSVTISSPSMMGTRDTVTDGTGQYRFAAVPPGEYKLVFALPGFATVNREGIRVTLGFTATVNVEMQLATQQETVTVTGESPVVDTQSARVTNNFEASQMANLPSARDYAALMAETPGVSVRRIDVGGGAALSENSYTTYGTGGQHRPLVEGMLASENTSLLFYTDYGSFDEVMISTAANNAEMPGNGVFTQFIAKSGGNSYHGNVYLDYYNKGFSSTNIDDELIRRGVAGTASLAVEDVNRTEKYRDLNFDLGGFIQKDKLWWYGSYRYTVNDIARPNFPVRPQHTQVANRTLKLTYNLTQNNKLIGFINHNGKSQPDRLSSNLIYLDTESTWNQIGFPVGVWKGELSSILSDAVYFETRAGSYFYNWKNRGKTSALRYEDIGTNIVRGGERDFFNERRRHQAFATLSYVKSGWAGTHNFKAGGEWMLEWFRAFEGNRPGNLVHRLRNGAPVDVILFDPGNESLNHLGTVSAYLADTWQVTQRVTATPGLRLDRYHYYLHEQTHRALDGTITTFPAQDDVYSVNNWGPRLGVTFDLTGNGRTVVKGNFGLFRDSPGVSLYNPNPPLWSKRYAWSDPNGNGVFDPGEAGQLLATTGGLFSESVDPNLKMGVSGEFAGWLERELRPNLGVRTGVVWRHQSQPRQNVNVNQPFDAFRIPVTIPDPGPDGVRGNADDRPGIQASNLDPQYIGRPTVTLRTFNPREQNDYWTWEITGTKRMSGRWSMLASFSHTWSDEGPNATNPNQLVNIGEDDRRHFTNWQAKWHGTFDLPQDFRVTPVVRFQSGRSFAREISAAFNYGSQNILSEPFDSRRTANIYLMDVRLDKGLRLKGARLGLFADVFNILNQNPEEEIITVSGGSFMRPTRIVPPRVARIGMKYQF